ncbi:hydroxynitrile lyase domain protein [Metarhizium robertsii]|uniref:Hydroxynitrile lyase domain protein n=1 Tax=Metarhizium robertsii TaxID=568076 RepID=A0A014QPT0_9HYPO|nr:hydroxynitrile lyase domain protein [Metarhizium robertsii]
MSKPTIILVHGFWANAAHWADVILLLNAKEDADRVRKAVRQVQGDVILVGHSYGGAVITEAGNLPSVVGLVFIAAFAPDKSESLASISAQYPAVATTEDCLSTDSDGYLWMKMPQFHETLCQDLPKHKALVMAVSQKAPVASVFGDHVTEPAWRDKPSWYQMSTDDRCIAPDAQKFMSLRMRAKKVIYLDAGYLSPSAQPKAVASLIDEAEGSV